MGQARSGQGLARLLGWCSLGLGAVQLTAPAAMNRLIGVQDTAAARSTMRAVGLQEAMVASGILRRPPRPGLLWIRVVSDVWHLGMLAGARRNHRNDSRRITVATSTVATVMLLDLVAAIRLGRSARSDRDSLRMRSTITVNRPAGEVYRFWRDLENLPQFMPHLKSIRVIDEHLSRWMVRAPTGKQVEWDAEITVETPERLIAWQARPGSKFPNTGTVRFTPAPGGAGTEVAVELDYQLPGGRVGAAFAALFGKEPEQQIKDALRRFKQVLETGEVVRSDGAPEGTLAGRQLRQLAAQPKG